MAMMPVEVKPPQVGDTGLLVGPNGQTMFRLQPRPGAMPFMANVAANLNRLLQGDLSPLASNMPAAGVDKGKRKRDAMADVLDGKNK